MVRAGVCARSNRVLARAYQGLARAMRRAGGGMHQFCAAGLAGRGGLWWAGGYVGGWYPAVGPSRPVSGPWRAIAGWARLGAGAGLPQ